MCLHPDGGPHAARLPLLQLAAGQSQQRALLPLKDLDRGWESGKTLYPRGCRTAERQVLGGRVQPLVGNSNSTGECRLESRMREQDTADSFMM